MHSKYISESSRFCCDCSKLINRSKLHLKKHTEVHLHTHSSNDLQSHPHHAHHSSLDAKCIPSPRTEKQLLAKTQQTLTMNKPIIISVALSSAHFPYSFLHYIYIYKYSERPGQTTKLNNMINKLVHTAAESYDPPANLPSSAPTAKHKLWLNRRRQLRPYRASS